MALISASAHPSNGVDHSTTVANTAPPKGSSNPKMDGKPTYEQLQARLAELETKLAKKNTMSIKISEKKAVSIYGLGRFPVTLYAPQWQRLLAEAKDILSFIEAHKGELSWEK